MNTILAVIIALILLLILLMPCTKNNSRYGYTGNSLEKTADKRYIYTPSVQVQANQPSQIRYGGIIPFDQGMNEYQASAYPIFMFNNKKIGENPAQDSNKIDDFNPDYIIGG